MNDKKENQTSIQGENEKRLINRKIFLRIAAGISAGLFAARPVFQVYGRDKTPTAEAKVSVTGSCLGCTGCVAICPVSAIAPAPGTITINQQKCLSCGYCAALCPVQGVRINRIDHNE
ncbi:4Fe-4S dicluster domain-containing protein [bacterium]|nr:4Fe-4S dicluster domain-containing protein [bacterium]